MHISAVHCTSGGRETADSTSGTTCGTGNTIQILHLTYCTERVEGTRCYGPLHQGLTTNGHQHQSRYQIAPRISR